MVQLGSNFLFKKRMKMLFVLHGIILFTCVMLLECGALVNREVVGMRAPLQGETSRLELGSSCQPVQIFQVM